MITEIMHFNRLLIMVVAMAPAAVFGDLKMSSNKYHLLRSTTCFGQMYTCVMIIYTVCI